jgi:hypothetical protein
MRGLCGCDSCGIVTRCSSLSRAEGEGRTGKGLVNRMEQYCQPRHPMRVLLFQQAHEAASKTSLTTTR